MEVIKFLANIFGRKKEALRHPNDFAIIDLPNVALRLGIKDDRNKIIIRFTVNQFGNYDRKKYRYSEERVDLLKEIHKIPVFDKTKLDMRFPVYSRVSPGEAKFNISR